MNDSNDTNEIFEIDFEVGHSSIIRSEPTTIHTPPRTHDWKIYVRSANVDSDLNCLIQRCVFHLHPEFPNNIRELKSTPFAIQETGYAGFHLPIEIYFKTKKEPRKFSIEYDLDLHQHIDGHQYRQKESYVRKYRCTFYNPDFEFRQKILKAGGKIVDSGPIVSNNTDTDQSDIDEEQESIIHHSPQQKRPMSPVLTANKVQNKKLKIEQSTNNNNNNLKKKAIQSTIKKSKLISHKSSSVIEEKPLNQTMIVNKTTSTMKKLDPLLSKVRTSTKLIKSQSTTDIKSIGNTTKKKESILSSPLKPKPIVNSKKSINKTSNSTIQSPLNVIPKQESSTIISSNSISNLKKIPKKLLPPSTTEKRSRLSLDRNSIRDSKTPQLNVKRDPSSSSVNNSQPSEKTNLIKIKSKPLPTIQLFQNEDNHLQLSDASNSPHEQVQIEPTTSIFYSDQSDINDEEDDLPTSLSNDDLRYKLIYIYKRFQLNSTSDLVIFVRFFKRHQLIDISSLSMTKSSNEMFTYDLFSLSPSHIIELASDLGYTTTNIINSIEQ